MKPLSIKQKIQEARTGGKKLLAVLIDPDKTQDDQKLKEFVGMCEYAQADLFLVGGSLLLNDSLERCMATIKVVSNIPVVLFPGSVQQVSPKADALLFLSLISGRNPELLIGQHVTAAPGLKKSGLEILPTGYILIDCGKATTVSYISNTQPIPYDKPEIAACTALAGEMLGLGLIYLDGGSGAQKPISTQCIQLVRQETTIPIITGGGIRSLAEAENAWNAGSDVVVIGTAFEKDPDLVSTFRNRNKVFNP